MVKRGIDTVDPTYYTPGTAMGRRKHRARTPGLWIATNELPRAGGHPFYQRLNQVLDTHAFDEFVEAQCAPFYADAVGRPSLGPGTYFRLLLIGYFEGIDSERGIAWRTADSLARRGFLGLGLDEVTPEHSTISRTRRLIDVETHRAVFTWILQVLATADLIRGKTIGIDATTLEANVALRSQCLKRDPRFVRQRQLRRSRHGTYYHSINDWYSPLVRAAHFARSSSRQPE